MEITQLYDTEALFPLDLVRPDTGVKIGIRFMIRSSSSQDAKKLQKQQTSRFIERHQKGKLLHGDKAIQQELEKAASYIASWDWGENTFHGEVPELSMQTAMEVLDEIDWFFPQVVEAAGELGNFTKK